MTQTTDTSKQQTNNISSAYMIWIYLRNNLTILGIQALLVMFALNASIVPRLNVQPFSYGETLLYCFILLVLTHSIKLFIVIDYFTTITSSLDVLRKQVSDISALNYNIGVTNLTKLIEIDDKFAKQLSLKESQMKLKDVKPLDKKTLTIKQIAKKHKCSEHDIAEQLKKGVTVEMEHTSDESVAKEIALDHLAEVPDYYDKLKTVEKK